MRRGKPAMGKAATTTRTGGRALVSGAGAYLIANIINSAIPFLLLPVLTRYMAPAEYGQVAMYQVWLTALGGLLGLSVHGAASVKYYDDDITHVELGAFIGSCFQILLLTTAIAIAIALPMRHAIGGWLGLRPEWVLWGVVVSAAGFIVQMRQSQWQVRNRPVHYGVFQIGSGLLNAGISIVLVVGLLQGAKGRIDAQNWTMLLAALLGVWLLAKDQLFVWSWRPDHLREALRFGVPLIPHVLGLFLLGTVDRMMINERLGLAEAGIYMVAVQLTMAMAILFSSINNAYVPWLYERLKRNDAAEKRGIVRLTYWYFVIVLVGALFAFPLGPWLVPLIAGERYAAAGNALGWLALGQAFAGMYLMVTNYIFFSKRTGLLSLVTISSGLLNVALLAVLIDRFGIVGAGMAFALAMGIRFFLTWWVAHKRHPMPWSQPQFFRA